MWYDLPVYLPQFLVINPDVKLVFFNIAFDVNVMGKHLFIPELDREGRCMELGANYRIHRLQTDGYFPSKLTLDYIVRHTLGVQLDKESDTRTTFSRSVEPSDEHLLYLAEDCIATERCGLVYNNKPTESLQAQAFFVLSEISHNGMLIDKQYIEKKQIELVSQMANQATDLRKFGFFVKRDVDDLNQIQRVARIADMVGLPDVESHITGAGMSSYPAAALWILAYNLITVLIGPDTPLLSDVTNTVRVSITPVMDTTIDWTAKNKQITELKLSALGAIKQLLDEAGVGDCIASKSPRAAIAMIICEILVDLFKAGVSDIKSAFLSEFKEQYERNLGWAAGTKPKTNAAFIQEHLRQLRSVCPELDLPLTDSSSEDLTEYLAGTANPDPAMIDKLSVYACKRDEMWRLTDHDIHDPFLELYTSYKHNEKLLKTYYTLKYVEEDGRNHSTFSPFLVTGRTASSAPNIQNLPKEPGLREQYLAPEGHVLLSVDYSMEEMVTLAATLQRRYGKSRMADAVNAGYCLHSLFAAYRDGILEGIDLGNLLDDNIQKEIKTKYKDYKIDPTLKKHRAHAKVANFGKRQTR